jgi:glucosamine--fructose-6-phosphate aminotransferase (isomerizing)
MAADARMLIGHCRYATQGDPDNNLNNHPHAADGGWYVHNGMVPDYRELMAEYDLCPVTDCDSEILGLLIEEGAAGLPQRCVRAVETIGDRDAVLLGLWPKPARLVAVRRGNPLKMSRVASGVYLGSLAGGLGQTARNVPDDTMLVLRRREGKCHVRQETIEAQNTERSAETCEVSRGYLE